MTLAGCGIKDNSTIRVFGTPEPDTSGKMQLFVLDIKGKTTTVEVDPADKIMQIMEQIHEKSGVRHIYQRLICGQYILLFIIFLFN